MKEILADITASITELKKNPSALLEEAGGTPIAILNHNTPTAYLLSAEAYEKLLDQLDDVNLRKTVDERKTEYGQAVEVDIDEL